jgi:pyruvate/2-oxoglutarate dehydrogenase complex dihydrolipoamide dehydrogenase (E3) component
MKAVVDARTGQILGAAVLGTEGGEIMTIIQVAMLGKLSHTAMANAIFTHPLLAEGLNSLFMTLDDDGGDSVNSTDSTDSAQTAS